MIKNKIVLPFFISILIGMALLNHFSAIGIGYFIAVILLWLLIVLWGSFFISSNYHVNTVCSNPLEKQKIISLTFDDGPNENTPLILDLLKKYDVKAAFFCIGKNIEKHPGIVLRAITEGHVVGNHSYSHSRFFDFFRKKKLIEELTKTDALLEQFTGNKIKLFRPPYGVTNPSIRRALEVTKHKVIGWNIRSLDGVVKDEKVLYSRIIKRVAPGGIVLLHDTSKHSVNVLEQLLQFLHKNNYTVVSLEQLLNIKAYAN
jgi:peptidoglycan/xylan/chitin deacetylase (PgdA/CDA1 family)